MEMPSAILGKGQAAGTTARAGLAADALCRVNDREPADWKEILDRIFSENVTDSVPREPTPITVPEAFDTSSSATDLSVAAEPLTPDKGSCPSAVEDEPAAATEQASVEELVSPVVPAPVRVIVGSPTALDMPVIASVTRAIDPLSDVSPQARKEAFAALDHAHHQVVAAECAELISILHAAQLWDVDPDDINATIERAAGTEQVRAYGHDGTPHLGEFLALEIGPLLGITPRSAVLRIGEALDLAYRLPQTLRQVLAGNIRVWQAVKASEKCKELPLAAALEVDAKLARALRTMTPGRANKHLDEWIISADPARAQQRAEAKRNARFLRISPIEDGHVSIYGIMDANEGILFDQILNQVAAVLPPNLDVADSFTDHDLRRAQALGHICRQWQQTSNQPLPGPFGATSQDADSDPDGMSESAHKRQAPPIPTHTLIVHINAADPALTATPAGVARVEGWGPLLATELPEFLQGSKVIIRPIIDPSAIQPTGSYQVPDKMRFAIEQRNPVDVFPYGTTAAKHCDQDHTIPYSRRMNAPPGQTRPGNLGPLSRTAHRAKTHGGWKLEQPAPGHYTWISRLGYRYSVTPDGTTRVTEPEPARRP